MIPSTPEHDAYRQILIEIFPNLGDKTADRYTAELAAIGVPAQKFRSYLAIGQKYGIRSLFNQEEPYESVFIVGKLWEKSIDAEILDRSLERIRLPKDALRMPTHAWQFAEITAGNTYFDIRPYVSFSQLTWKGNGDWFNDIYIGKVPLYAVRSYVEANPDILPFTIRAFHHFRLSPSIYAEYYA
jgi:hypothetical protein